MKAICFCGRRLWLEVNSIQKKYGMCWAWLSLKTWLSEVLCSFGAIKRWHFNSFEHLICKRHFWLPECQWKRDLVLSWRWMAQTHWLGESAVTQRSGEGWLFTAPEDFYNDVWKVWLSKFFHSLKGECSKGMNKGMNEMNFASGFVYLIHVFDRWNLV